MSFDIVELIRGQDPLEAINSKSERGIRKSLAELKTANRITWAVSAPINLLGLYKRSIFGSGAKIYKFGANNFKQVIFGGNFIATESMTKFSSSRFSASQKEKIHSKFEVDSMDAVFSSTEKLTDLNKFPDKIFDNKVIYEFDIGSDNVLDSVTLKPAFFNNYELLLKEEHQKIILRYTDIKGKKYEKELKPINYKSTQKSSVDLDNISTQDIWVEYDLVKRGLKGYITDRENNPLISGKIQIEFNFTQVPTKFAKFPRYQYRWNGRLRRFVYSVVGYFYLAYYPLAHILWLELDYTVYKKPKIPFI